MSRSSSISRREAQAYLRKLFPRRLRFIYPNRNVWFWRATTAELRRVLHDKATPRGVRVHVYSMLLARRS